MKDLAEDAAGDRRSDLPPHPTALDQGDHHHPRSIRRRIAGEPGVILPLGGIAVRDDLCGPGLSRDEKVETPRGRSRPTVVERGPETSTEDGENGGSERHVSSDLWSDRKNRFAGALDTLDEARPPEDPPFAIAAMNRATWSGVTSTRPWPIATFAVSPGNHARRCAAKRPDG